MDALSDVLSLIKPRSYKIGGFTVSGSLAVKFPTTKGIKCYSILAGECWLVVEGVSEPVRLTAGECYLLPRGLPFHLTTDLSLDPIDYTICLAVHLNGDAGFHNAADSENSGTGCSFAGGHFLLDGAHAEVLLGSLPPIIHIQKESDKEAMRWSIERMRCELREPQPGGSLVAQQLAYMMLVQALRLHVAEGPRGGVGWLFALADPQMNAAIQCMHDDPSQDWTLQKLARCAGMSRSTFAMKFKQITGESPMEYLTRWRMLLAGDRLTNTGDSISAIARSLGYDSESAFGKAFKREMGCSPRQYSRGNAAPMETHLSA
jgi:AraC-like DNA-binding protein